MQNSNTGQDGLSQTRQSEGKTAATHSLLEQAINDYLQWMTDMGYCESTRQSFRQILLLFVCFVRSRQTAWDEVFRLDTLRAFQGKKPLDQVQRAVKGLAQYLFEHKRIDKPLMPVYRLPEIYEQYLCYYKQGHQTSPEKAINVKRVLFAFHQYLEKSDIKLSRISIEQIDAFLAKFLTGYASSTCRLYRTYLRGFLRYLYQQQGILKRDLAPLVVGAPQFDRGKPPKFLRPQELKKLFDDLSSHLCTTGELRTCAMVHLAYCLGLRPREISLISLDDICFLEQQLRLPVRKGSNSITLPVPDETLKAIAAYTVGRPKSKSRRLFLNLHPPHKPVRANSVSRCIGDCMRKLKLPSTAYWLRHSYAQNLLEAGMSIYEIKEMMGHDTIESTRKYLHVHIKLMREVLFDETI